MKLLAVERVVSETVILYFRALVICLSLLNFFYAMPCSHLELYFISEFLLFLIG